MTLHGGVFSISGSEAVVDSLSTVLNEHQSDSNTEQKVVGELVAVHLVVSTNTVGPKLTILYQEGCDLW